jgi:tRNA A37 methylthiotransferase MiaB
VATPPRKVGFVSLGCPKALVDSEHILTQLRAEGYLVSGTYQDADLVVVNTCGFIDAAVEESLDAIGEALHENGRVIVTGCLGAEPDYITGAHPKVLAVTGPRRSQSLPDVPSLAEAAVPGYSFFSLNAAFAHAAMPDELVRRMSEALAGVSRSREYAELTRNLGIEGDFADVQAFSAAVPAERQFWADLIRTSGAKGG